MPALPLGALARRLGCELTGGDPEQPIDAVTALDLAGPRAIAPLLDEALWVEEPASRAAALLVRRARGGLARGQLTSAEPRRALGLALELFRPARRQRCGRQATAVVDPSATVAADAYLGAYCVVEAGARIGAGSQIEAGSFVGEGVAIGARCRIGPHAVILADCELDDDVVIAPGAVVGGAGFGYWQDAQGQWQAVASIGRVRLERGAELGANSCVDRATVGVTRVGAGSKVDNLVQIGHNVRIGRDALLCAQVGLAGSVRVEDGAQLGGQVGVGDHLTIGPRARVAGGSGVVRNVVGGATVAGYPAIDRSLWLRSSAIAARLAQLVRQVRALGRAAGESAQAAGLFAAAPEDEGRNHADD